MNTYENNGKSSKDFDKTNIDDLEEDEFLELTGMEEEEKRKSRQFNTILKPELADEADRIIKDDLHGSTSEYLRELVRRDVIARRDSRATFILSKLMGAGKVTTEDIAEVLRT